MVKHIKKIIMYLYIIFKEKRYPYNGKVIKYLLQNNRSDKLLIVFSGFSEVKARYNYIRSLNKLKNINKLFILDDFGYEKKGSYYLAEDGDFSIQSAVLNLILYIKKHKNIKNLVCAGSSKGGTAAVMFGCLLETDMIVCGAPQYYIGSYLNTKEHTNILRGIIGRKSEIDNYDSNEISRLNQIVKQTIENCVSKPKVYIHYSENEHTFDEHIKFLIHDLMENKYEVSKDIREYECHQDVAKYFGKFLYEICERFINN